MIDVSINFDNNTITIDGVNEPMFMVDDAFLAAMAPAEDDEDEDAPASL